MKKKIVVIDDQEDIRQIIETILLKQGYEVATCSNGTLLDSTVACPDLIIIDINLEEADGREICRKFKNQYSTMNIPVILMSAIMDLPKISIDCGAEDFLSKPFRLYDLVNKVQKNLQAA
jgi:DNA-binding response OmpR family regulator